MLYVLVSLARGAGVILLAALGVALGRWFSRLQSPAWLLGYIVPLLLVASIALCRWVPRLEAVSPFRWIMAGRREFAALALVCTTLFTTPLRRLEGLRRRVAVAVFMVVATAYLSLRPFVAPAFTHGRLSELRTTINADGVCLQGTRYTCGPAAAVTVLRGMGIEAEEGELALRAHSNPFAGTPSDSLWAAMRQSYGTRSRRVYRRHVAELRGEEPFIALVKFGFLVDHYVAVLQVGEETVTLGDPLRGRRRCTRGQFEKQWRRMAILPRKGPGK